MYRKFSQTFKGLVVLFGTGLVAGLVGEVRMAVAGLLAIVGWLACVAVRRSWRRRVIVCVTAVGVTAVAAALVLDVVVVMHNTNLLSLADLPMLVMAGVQAVISIELGEWLIDNVIAKRWLARGV